MKYLDIHDTREGVFLNYVTETRKYFVQIADHNHNCLIRDSVLDRISRKIVRETGLELTFGLSYCENYQPFIPKIRERDGTKYFHCIYPDSCEAASLLDLVFEMDLPRFKQAHRFIKFRQMWSDLELLKGIFFSLGFRKVDPALLLNRIHEAFSNYHTYRDYVPIGLFVLCLACPEFSIDEIWGLIPKDSHWLWIRNELKGWISADLSEEQTLNLLLEDML